MQHEGSRIDREIELARVEKAGFDAYPGAQNNYPDPSDPLFKEKELRYIKGWNRGKAMLDNHNIESEPDGTAYKGHL